MLYKTLYVTDLDGTLLTNDAKVSAYTTAVINSVIEKGAFFTYATARAFTSASNIMKNITPSIPVIVYNGTFIVDAADGKRISVKSFSEEEKSYILNVFKDNGVSPIVYSIINGVEKYSFCYDELPSASKVFLNARKGDDRENPTTRNCIGVGEVFHFSSLADGEKLSSIQSFLKKDFPAELFPDRYFHEMFLEIHPKCATKAEGVLELKKILGCNRVVCFGDGNNDIPMFHIADECYSMANAEPALKEIATAVIDDNESDGVAKWIEANLL